MAMERHEQAFGPVGPTPPAEWKPGRNPVELPRYANFVRVSSTPEEVVLTLGLNPEPWRQDITQLQAGHSMVLLHHTAKGFAAELRAFLDRHERQWGHIETDIRKRVKSPQ